MVSHYIVFEDPAVGRTAAKGKPSAMANGAAVEKKGMDLLGTRGLAGMYGA